jgi:hypothetical protein
LQLCLDYNEKIRKEEKAKKDAEEKEKERLKLIEDEEMREFRLSSIREEYNLELIDPNTPSSALRDIWVRAKSCIASNLFKIINNNERFDKESSKDMIIERFENDTYKIL